MKQLIIIFILSTFSVSTFAQANIHVEGKSSVKLVPEQLIFSVNISVKDIDYNTCANMAVEKIEKIKSQFSKNGVDEKLIKTQNYSIREIRKHDYKTQKSVFEGYQASIPITITTQRDYSKNDVIYEIIKDNFNADFNLNFALTAKQIEKVKAKLIDLAVKDAQQKAEVISKSADIKLGKISAIQYGEPRKVQPYNNNYDLMTAGNMKAMSAESSISKVMNPEEIEMRTEIMISWAIN